MTTSSSSAAIRRREKRRHVSSPIDMGDDPLQLLSLAVRVDETSSIRHSLPLLEEPLENGRLYNTDDFLQAVEFLNQITTAPPTRKRSSNSSSIVVPLLDWLFSSPAQDYPTVALTPVILSGLIAAQRARDTSDEPQESSLGTSELMTHCIAMRRAALQRVNWERKRRKIQRIAMVLFLILFMVVMYVRNMARMKETMMELGYLGVFSQQQDLPTTLTKKDTATQFLLPCASTTFLPVGSIGNQQINENKNDILNGRWKWFLSVIPGSSSVVQPKQHGDFMGDKPQVVYREGWAGYMEACYASEANLWAHFRDSASASHKGVRTCPLDGCSADFRSRIRRHLGNIPGRSSIFRHDQGPYAMHTIAERNQHMLTGSRGFREKVHLYQQLSPPILPEQQQQKDGGGECDYVNKDIIWLGDSTIHGLVRTLLEKKFHVGESGKQGALGEPVRILDVGCGVGALAFALSAPMNFLQDNLPESCWGKSSGPTRQFRYHGISISAAEVWHARTLAKDHGMDLGKVRFDQLSFDDPSLSASAMYSAAIAIESLSYSQNITTTLSVLSKALKPGGTLVVVNDVTSGFGVDDLDEKDSQSWQPPTLLSHGQWLQHLEETGFVVEEALDIGLHYDLPELINERKPKNLFYKFYKWLQRQLTGTDPFLQTIKDETPTNGIIDNAWKGIGAYILRVDPLMKFLQSWEDWIGPRVATDYLDAMRVVNVYHVYDKSKLSSLVRNFASLRIVQIFQGHFRRSRRESLRKEAHRRGDLTYNMYICRKL